MVEVQRPMRCLESFKKIKFRKNKDFATLFLRQNYVYKNFASKKTKESPCNIKLLRIKFIALEEDDIYFMKKKIFDQLSCS